MAGMPLFSTVCVANSTGNSTLSLSSSSGGGSGSDLLSPTQPITIDANDDSGIYSLEDSFPQEPAEHPQSEAAPAIAGTLGGRRVGSHLLLTPKSAQTPSSAC